MSGACAAGSCASTSPSSPDATASRKTFSALKDWWIEYRAGNPNLGNQKGHLTHILEHPISRIEIDKLDPETCSKWVLSLSGAPNTVRNIVSTAKRFVEDCRANHKTTGIDYRTYNPFGDRIVTKKINGGKPVTKVSGRDKIAFDLAPLATLLTCTKIPAQRLVLYWLAVGTGCREGEAYGLVWRNVVLDVKVPHVRLFDQLPLKQYRVGDNLKAPKKDSERVLALHPSVAAMLAWWKDKGWIGWVGRKPTDDDPVFPDQEGAFGAMVKTRFT